MNSIFKIFFLFTFFLLNNCSVSNFLDSLNYSKTGVDVYSYTVTNKTTNDHVLSYLFDKDCSLSRTLKLKKICNEIQKDNFDTINENIVLIETKKENYKKKITIKKKIIKVPSMAY